MRRRALRFAAIAFALSVPVASAGAAERARPGIIGDARVLSARSADGRVIAELRFFGVNPDGWLRYRITAKRAGVVTSATYVSFMEQVRALNLTGDGRRATATGWASGGHVNMFDTVDVKTGTLLVEVPCYRPTISPSGRYIAFIQWHVPHSTTMVHHTAIYRVAEIASLPRKRSQEDVMDRYVGTEVYPKSPLTIPLNSRSTDEREIHELVGGFEWYGDGHLSFGDRYHGRETTVDVTIGRSGLNAMRVTTRRSTLR